MSASSTDTSLIKVPYSLRHSATGMIGAMVSPTG